jgi:hypothetical protein
MTATYTFDVFSSLDVQSRVRDLARRQAQERRAIPLGQLAGSINSAATGHRSMIMNRPSASTGGYTSVGGLDISCVLSGLPAGGAERGARGDRDVPGSRRLARDQRR